MRQMKTNWTAAGATLALTVIVAFSTLTRSGPAHAQQASATPQQATPMPKLLDPNDTVILLLDHQTGLFQTVKDIPIRELRANAVVLAKAARHGNIPIFTTASEPGGPNGPLMPELTEAALNATYIPRKGEISSWENEDFRKAVKATGRKTLIIAGVWTSVCVAFPALQAKAEGYNVYAVVDASGDLSEMASQATLARLTQAGIIPVTTNVVLAEFQRTWARPDAAAWGALYNELVPHYRAVSESYQKAQATALQTKK